MSLRVLLVGAGHAHLYVIRRAKALGAAGLDLCLVSPATFSYSGLATGALSGALSLRAGEVDIVALAAAHGVRHHPTTVEHVDLTERRAHLVGGGFVDFDIVSFNVGSTIADPLGLSSRPRVWPVKPLAALLPLRDMVEREMAAAGRCPAIVIAGGGQTAFEISAALCGLCGRHGVRPNITVVGSRVDAAWMPAKAARRLLATLRTRGVEFRADQVVSRTSDWCRLASGGSLACDALVLATGLVAADIMRTLDLPVDEQGRLRVSSRLRTACNHRVFAVGDCGVMEDDPRPCMGLFGVRAAPVLVRNLVALARKRRLVTYRPQRHWLSIMDLGDGTGLALRGHIWWLGRTALRLKRGLDLGFVRRARLGSLSRFSNQVFEKRDKEPGAP